MVESGFGARRVRGIRGRGARGKPIVFGLLKREGKADAKVVENGSVKARYPISKAGVGEDSVSDTDVFKTCDGLIDFGYRKHDRAKHGEHEFAKGHTHINGIENLWGLAKTGLIN